MSSDMYARIRSNPQFTEMVRRREGFAWKLSAIVFVIFYAFVLLVAFAPDVIAMRPFSGSHVTVGILAGLFQFIFFWLLTLIYVRRANGEFDDMNKEMIALAVKESK